MKKAAEILVKCGYAKELTSDANGVIEGWVRIRDSGYGTLSERVDPFANNLEGRRQADAIEDWLIHNGFAMQFNEMCSAEPIVTSRHQWRLDRIKWCLDHLPNPSKGDRHG